MQIEYLYMIFSSPFFMLFFFIILFFSLLHLFFITFFQFFCYKQNCRQLLLLMKVKITVNHHLFHQVNSVFYSYFAFFSRLSRFPLTFYFQILNSKPWLLTMYPPLILSECNYLVY